MPLSKIISYRIANTGDIPAMSAIRLAVRENKLSNPSRVTSQMYSDYLSVRGGGWVAEIDGMIIGFSYADFTDNSIWALFVHPDHEGCGAGQQLFALACAFLFERGADCVTLSTTPNTRADHFYLRHGGKRGEMKDDEVVFRFYPTQFKKE